MNLALGVVFLWIGAACLFLASHGMEASTPWGAFQTLLTNMSKGVDFVQQQTGAV